MNTEHDEQLKVGPADPAYYGAALWMATGGQSQKADRSHVVTLLSAEKRGLIHFRGLFTAMRGTRLVASSWCLEQAGRIATIWGPYQISSEPDSTAQQLIDHVIQFAKNQQCHLMQSLIASENHGVGENLKAAGFHAITRIDHLQAYAESFDPDRPSLDLEFVPCEDFTSELFRQLVCRTYESSYDCPELDGLREIEDVLEGYYATSGSSTEHWYLVQRDGEAAGVAIVAHHEDSQQLELIYFGLLPKFRGTGLGGEILRFVLRLAGQLDCEMVLTGVDARNLPALALYRRFGFQQVDGNQLYLLSLRGSSAAVA